MDCPAQLDHAHIWHPFTQMRDWLKREPIVITSGRGAVLRDTHGREYLDANSSIWTNLHGHQNPRINEMIARQLNKIAHSSALGLANEPASFLAERLTALANPPFVRSKVRIYKHEKVGEARGHNLPFSHLSTCNSLTNSPELSKVFYSDDGSTAMEVALKLAYEFIRRTRGPKTKPRFLSLAGAYHGDTMGAVSLGHLDLFHKAYTGLLFPTDQVMAPYCYRCPFNRAKPERSDAREYRKCNWECVRQVEQKFSAMRKRGNLYAGFAFEPLLQGAAGMIPQPTGWLRRVTEIARSQGALLIADEVMTGFGRANSQSTIHNSESPVFACHQESVQPDFLCLAKGLTGGYLPMAATLTTKEVFDVFLGRYDEFKTFFHGHSFTGNQLGAAAALGSLEILQSQESFRARGVIQRKLSEELKSLWSLPNIGDIRQVGLIVGVELVRNYHTRTPFALRDRAGIRVCEAMARRGVLTRAIGNVIVLMPPYCMTAKQTRRMVEVLAEAISEIFTPKASR
jgi:adenosylmethionine---8-amino-7-oxononanoate aminotransferase